MRTTWILSLLMALFMGVTLTACPEKEGANKVKEDIKDAAEDAGDEIEDAAEDAAEETNEAIDDATD